MRTPQTIECPFCRRDVAEVRDTRDGLVVMACRNCNGKYSREYGRPTRYEDGFQSRYSSGDYAREYDQPIKVDPAELARLKEQTALTAALNAEKKIAAERNRVELERKNLLNLLKETGLDQCQEG